MLSRSQTIRRNSRNSDLECESLHGTIKLTGKATYAIENCGGCNCTLLIKKLDDGSFHQPYDESDVTTDDTQLTNEVLKQYYSSPEHYYSRADSSMHFLMMIHKDSP